MTSRRSFLTGFGASLIAAPAVVRAASLMPVRGTVMPIGKWSDAPVHVGTPASFDSLKHLVWKVTGLDHFGSKIQKIVPVRSRQEAFGLAGTREGFSVVQFVTARWVVTDGDPLPEPSFSRAISPLRDPHLFDWKAG